MRGADVAAKKSWTAKFRSRTEPEVAVLEKPFAGVPAGARLLISTPARIAAYVAAIPAGETRDVAAMRADLAAQAGADATCPMTTGMFARIAAEAALEEVAAGAKLAEVTPFWRLIDPESPLAGKLSCGRDLIRTMRAAEAQG